MSREFNFIILNGNELPGDDILFFPGENVVFVPDGMTMLDLLVMSNVFQSKSQARKAWDSLQQKIGLEDWNIPMGWNDFQGIGKLKTRITVLRAKPCLTTLF